MSRVYLQFLIKYILNTLSVSEFWKAKYHPSVILNSIFEDPQVPEYVISQTIFYKIGYLQFCMIFTSIEL